MNGESCRLKQSAGRHRRAIGAEQNQITVALVEDEPADEPDSAATA